MPELPRCDDEIYSSGTLVMMTHTIGSEAMEGWVKRVAEKSGQPVDWHYAAGRACVLALGDLVLVRGAIHELMPEHDELQRQASAAICDSFGLPPRPYTASCTLYNDNEWNPAHEYVRQLNAEASEERAGNA